MGVTSYGENNPNAKLTDSEVELIRALYAGDTTPGTKRFWTAKILAQKFEISERQVHYILRGDRRP